jgi:phosphoserine phosphatase
MSEANETTKKQRERPLVLDVDGTMIRSDITHEMLFEGAKRRPWAIPKMVTLGLRSKPALKAYLVRHIGDHLAIEHVPLEPKAVALARAAKAEGRAVYLCSGSEQSLVERLAATLDFIDGAFGTTGDYNMTSENKAKFLVERFPGGFDYAGNSTQDYAVWAVAQTAYAIRPPRDTVDRVSATGDPVEILEERRMNRGALLRAVFGRGHLWMAPFFFLIALILRAIDSSKGVNAFDLAVISLLFLSLSLTIFGGMASVHDNRHRPIDRLGPFDRGDLSLTTGLKLSVAVLGLAVLLSIWTQPPLFSLVLVGLIVTAWLGHGRSAAIKWAVRIFQAGLIGYAAAVLFL